MFNNIHDICSERQQDNLVCPHNQVFFTASAVWYVKVSQWDISVLMGSCNTGASLDQEDNLAQAHYTIPSSLVL
jgi:hypothetical protein